MSDVSRYESLRLRLTNDEVALLDGLCGLSGVTREEYVTARIMGRPVPFHPDRGRLADSKAPTKSVERTYRKRESGKRSRRSMRLTVGSSGRRCLRLEAQKEGTSVSSLVACRATTGPEGAEALERESRAVERAVGLVRAFGYATNEIARAANSAAIVARREHVDRAELSRLMGDACSLVYEAEGLEGSLGAVEKIAKESCDGREDRAGEDSPDTDRPREGEEDGGPGGRARGEVGALATLPTDDARRTVLVWLRPGEVEEIREIADSLCLTTGEWVLVSCTRMFPRWRPFDTFEGMRLVRELAREATNLRQTRSALDAVRAVATGEMLALADEVLAFVDRVEPRVDTLRGGVLRRVLDARAVID